MRRTYRIFILFCIILPITIISIKGCTPIPGSISRLERINHLPADKVPLKYPVKIYWNENQIPFIEAQSDSDLATSLGVIHAHLRLGQMNILKRVAQGRISEMAGPFTKELDHALRILGLQRGADKVIAAMSPETKDFVNSFLIGVNYYQDNVKELPLEFSWAGIDKEPFTMIDIVSMMRLAGADVSWFTFLRLLKEKSKDDFENNYSRYLGLSATDSYIDSPLGFLSEHSRSGSNSMVVAGSRTESKKPLIFNDPHLGFQLPNLWLLVGIKSPSYHAVGMMIPGLPFIAIGRNPDLAWGGTNMRAASSEIVDVTDLPESDIKTYSEEIVVRNWFNATRKIRLTSYGPILNDAALLEVDNSRLYALKWLGHLPSDEIGAFLQATRSSTVSQFRNSFESYGVSGQNILVATDSGDIAHIFAAKLPKRPQEQSVEFIKSMDQIDKEWGQFETALSLPFIVNPQEGLIASANNKVISPSTTIGYYFSPDDRVLRLKSLTAGKTLNINSASQIQRDLYSENAQNLARQIASITKLLDMPSSASIIELLQNWDGIYGVRSREAAIFEVMLSKIVSSLYNSQILRSWDYVSRTLIKDLDNIDQQNRRRILSEAIEEANKVLDGELNWGDLHMIRVQHPFGNIPIIGRLFRFGDYSIGGSRETLMKTSHGFESERHYTSYGSQSRHISDLSDPDANYFILFGGQDGWIESENYLDQLPLFFEGRFIKIPLRLESVKESFREITILQPLAK